MSIRNESPVRRICFTSATLQRMRRRPARLGVALLTLTALAVAFLIFALCACRGLRH